MQKLNVSSDRHSVLNASQIGIEFEFYSNLELEETQKSLSELLNRKIRLEEKAHSDSNQALKSLRWNLICQVVKG